MRYITGRGAHSPDGEAKLKKAVVAWLESVGHLYVEGLGYVDVKLEVDVPTPQQA